MITIIDQKEWHSEYEVAEQLQKAGIGYRRKYRMDLGLDSDSKQQWAIADFVMFKHGKAQALIEVKRDGRPHSIITAVGQCLMYGEWLGINDGPHPKFARRAIICSPYWWDCPGDIIYFAENLGIEFCEPKQIVGVVLARLNNLPPIYPVDIFAEPVQCGDGI